MAARSHAVARRRHAVVGAGLLTALAWSFSPVAEGAQADEPARQAVGSCNGRTATQVGEPGASMIGTAGDDVFITRGATRVDTGAGDDSICVTGQGSVVVNAGPDNDFVGARQHAGKAFVSLGFGDDLFYGGAGDDRVWSQEASNQNAADDRDQVYTGGGSDYVISGSSSAPNGDRVHLGPGDDVLVTYGLAGSASLVGGIGTNTYQPIPGPDESGEWTFDNVTGEATLDGVPRLVWTSFQQFDLEGLQGPRVRFLGSRASESVSAGGTCQVVLRGRSGHDRLTVGPDGCNNLPAGDALLVGGPGDDFLQGASGADVLRGGKGRDRADGGLGIDRCVAETRISC